jgi:hypothetical protein
MLVTTIASMPRGVATMRSRWGTCRIVVVKVHPEVAGGAAASASWSPAPRGFWGDNSSTMVRRDLWWVAERGAAGVVDPGPRLALFEGVQVGQRKK